MIQRRILGVCTGLALLAAHCNGRTQPGAAMRRVGVLMPGSQASSAGLIAAFKQGMADGGWLEGKNIDYRIGYANGDLGRFDALAIELVAQQVELIVLSTSLATRAAHSAAPSLPIVMISVSNVVQQGFVASLARPGGSITGLTNQAEDVQGKAIEMLHELVPGARRIAVLLSGNSIITDLVWADAQRACAALGLTARRIVATEPARIPPAVEQIAAQQSQAVVVPLDGMYFAERVRLQALLQAARLPVAYSAREHVLAGGLFSYGPNIGANFRYAAKYVDKVLKGARPGDLPIEQPTRFELVINLATAKALGITVPQSLLARADEVIQ